jgi:hypothetical protein
VGLGDNASARNPIQVTRLDLCPLWGMPLPKMWTAGDQASARDSAAVRKMGSDPLRAACLVSHYATDMLLGALNHVSIVVSDRDLCD